AVKAVREARSLVITGDPGFDLVIRLPSSEQNSCSFTDTQLRRVGKIVVNGRLTSVDSVKYW
ncbi:hypothetical protein, partial [Methylobacterium radiotolerans]|uniref:hypothetical protein n=1 Tax=Methylobacterium radiotolerans TaxID=31998 RepID=UPI001AEDA8FD